MGPKSGIKRRLLDVPDSGSAENVGGSSSSAAIAPRSGGTRKLLRAAEKSDAAEKASKLGCDESLPLNQSLRRMWAKGELTSPQVQELASGAAKQGAMGVDKMAKVGSDGCRPGNIFRDLVNAFGYPQGAPRLYWAKVPLEGGLVSHPFILPHLFFAHLFGERKEEFAHAVLGGHKDCRSFWCSDEGKKIASEHPVLKNKTAEDLYATVPLGMHGDGGAYSKQDSLYVVSWNSLMGLGSTTSKRFIFTLLRKAKMLVDTWAAIWTIFAWSMNILLDGFMPRLDFLGRLLDASTAPVRIAGRFCAALIQVRGDWGFYCEVLDFPKHNELVNMCWICSASIENINLRYTDATPHAGWRPTVRNHAKFLAWLVSRGIAIPILFAKVIGLLMEYVCIDVLHTLDQG